MSKPTVSNFHIPRWNELPNLDLYLDQLVTILEKNLKDYIGNKDETIITKAMINNYVKQGLIKPPKKKKYNELMLLAIKTVKFNSAYDQFCEALEKAILYTFDGIEYTLTDEVTFEQSLLKSVAQSFASKLYVENTFLHK